MRTKTKEYKARIRAVETQLKAAGISPDDLQSWFAESQYPDYEDVFKSEANKE